MKLTAEHIAEIIRRPETAHVECKSASGGLPNTMWETYSSFANTDGGVILLGIRGRNHRFSVQGVSDADLLVKQIWDAVNNREVVSVSFPGHSAEGLMHMLDLKGIAVSTGAACDSKNTQISHVQCPKGRSRIHDSNFLWNGEHN